MDKITTINELLTPRSFPMGYWEEIKAIASEAYDAGVASVQPQNPDEPLALWEYELLAGADDILPDVIRTAADVALPWPDGTRVVDNHGDRWEKRRGVWTIVRWSWQVRDELNDTDYLLDKYLPATVTKESN